MVDFSGVILPPNGTHARNLDCFPPFLISSSPYKNGYVKPLFLHPFLHFLAVLEVVKFMPMTQRNCRPFALSLFSVHADGVKPRSRYSPDKKYCSDCNLFRVQGDIIPVFFKKSLSSRNYSVSAFILNGASNTGLF